MSAHIKERLTGITGAIFMVLALFQLLFYVRTIQYGFAALSSLMTFLVCAVYMFLSIWLLLRRRDVFLLLALAVLCGARFFAIFLYGWRVLPILHAILLFLAAAALLVLCMIQYCDAFARHRAVASRLMFLPAAFLALGILIAMIITGNSMAGAPGLSALLRLLADIFAGPIFAVAGYYCLAWWFATTQEEPLEMGVSFFAVEEGAAPARGRNAAPIPAPRPEPGGEGYCDLLKHVVLLIFTFGIWYLIWIYRMTSYLNRVEGEQERDPLKKLLLCILVPFYSIYWIYRSAQRIDRLAAQTGVYSALSTFCLVTAFLGAVLPVAFMQEKINLIVMAEKGYAPLPDLGEPPRSGQSAAPQSGQSAAGQSVSERILELKALLDVGAITQEDYDQKKKEILQL